MPLDRSRSLSRHYALGDLLIDPTFPDLAEALDPDVDVLANLGRLGSLLDQLTDEFPPKFEVLSGYRDAELNDACIQAGMPASVHSLHLAGCAADVRPTSETVDAEAVFDWLQFKADDVGLHEAVFYPKKGFIHVAVADHARPTPRRILMRM